MTNKAKKVLIITGLIVCLIITVLANTEAGDQEHSATYNVSPPAGATQVIVNTGTRWIIQTTYKLLTPIQ